MPGQPLTQSSPTHSSLPSREGAAGRALLTLCFRLPSWNAEGGVGEGKGGPENTPPPTGPSLADTSFFRRPRAGSGVRNPERQSLLFPEPVCSSVKRDHLVSGVLRSPALGWRGQEGLGGAQVTHSSL